MRLRSRDLMLSGRLEATSLAIPAGQLVCLVGPNGSGKTSLLHAIAGIGGAAGRVSIDGVDPSRLSPDQRKRLYAYLPASRDIRWPISAVDLIALGLPSDAGRESIAPLLDALSLAELADRPVDSLSTGERSRVLIARALVAEPRLLLLDEPVANLDPLWQLKLMELLRMLTGDGRSALVAMHDLDLAARYADRMVIMNEGRIVADGEPRDLLGGGMIPDVFGIERSGGAWQPVRPADRRSLR